MTILFLFISAALYVMVVRIASLGGVNVSELVAERSYIQCLYYVTTSKSGVTEDEVEVNIEGSNIIVALTNAYDF